MSSSSNGDFEYPDPELYGINAPSIQPHPYYSLVPKVPVVPVASAPAAHPAFAPPPPPPAHINAAPAPAPAAAIPNFPGPVVARPVVAPLLGIPAPPAAFPVLPPTPLAAPPAAAPAQGSPPYSCIGTKFPGFPAGIHPPVQITGRDAQRWRDLVAGNTLCSVLQT